MKTTRDLGLLFQRYTTQLLRNPVWLFVGFSTRSCTWRCSRRS